MPWRRRCIAAGTGARVQLGTGRSASSGHPKCREIATYVHDPGHYEPPDDRRGNSSVPGCGGKSQAVRGSLADRIKKGEKRSCCVTTRRRNFWLWNGLGRGLGLLAAHSFCLGMLGSGVGIPATFSLPLRCLPAENLPLTFRLLAVALVPAPWLILASAPFTQAAPRRGRRTLALGRCFPLTWWLPTGGSISQGIARGGCVSILLGRYQNANKTIAC